MKRLTRCLVGVCFFLLAGVASPGGGMLTGASAIGAEPELPPVLLQMARDPAVHQELQLSSGQVTAVLEATDQVDRIWWPSRILPDERRLEVVDRLTRGLRTELLQILDVPQRRRLRELERQALGTRMLLTGDVADALKISSEVRGELRDIALRTDVEVRAFAEEQAKSIGDSAVPETQAERARKLQALRARERREMVDLLTETQRREISTLVGEGFDFARVKRTNPRAPELEGEVSEWLQGGPVKLSDLRGRVVLLHFYAFQCINCRRNLPLYNEWVKDFPAADVAVIGIQTPETAAEREPEQVRAALQREAITYPVLFDGESRNWKAWGNTMWPTVYLIDRDGFIRTWWQGELNWQGANGDERFRGLIRQVIEEPSAGRVAE